jgi:hypothetical protein
MLNKWAFILNLFAFILLGVLLFFQYSEVTAYVDTIGDIFK